MENIWVIVDDMVFDPSPSPLTPPPSSPYLTPDTGTPAVESNGTSSLVPQQYLNGSSSPSLNPMIDSLLVDLDGVLTLIEPDCKTVEFQPYTPPSMHYVVSNEVDVSTLRKPKKLCPEYCQHTPITAQDLVQSSTILQEAASKATVKLKAANHLKLQSGSCSCSIQSNKSNQSDESHSYSHRVSKPRMSLNVPSARTGQFVEIFIKQNPTGNVYFDKISVTESNQKTVLLSSRPLTEGTHEWRIEILKCDVELQVENHYPLFVSVGILSVLSDIDPN